MIKAPWLMSGKEIVLTYSRKELVWMLLVFLFFFIASLVIWSQTIHRIEVELGAHKVEMLELLKAQTTIGINKRMAVIEKVVVDQQFIDVYGGFLKDLQKEELGEKETARVR